MCIVYRLEANWLRQFLWLFGRLLQTDYSLRNAAVTTRAIGFENAESNWGFPGFRMVRVLVKLEF